MTDDIEWKARAEAAEARCAELEQARDRALNLAAMNCHDADRLQAKYDMAKAALSEIQERAREWDDMSMIEVIEALDDIASRALNGDTP
jgi:hypothetical protein